MDSVKQFNSELCSLYELKPPISRTKMAEVTELAIKSVKFYKHIVQSVEKFIQKCQPEYKVPGLYVIDSIVRESRRQFGPDKDLFAPRFSKGFPSTFQNLLLCPSDDKCRIVRVLNLWQKNGVFPPAVIQPLLNIAGEPTTSSSKDSGTAGQSVKEALSVSSAFNESQSTSLSSNLTPVATSRAATKLTAAETLQKKLDVEQQECTADLQGTLLKTITQLMHQPQQQSLLPTLSLLQLQLLQQQLAQQLPMMVDSTAQQQQTPSIDTGLLAQIQTLTSVLMNRSGQTTCLSPNSADDTILETAELIGSVKKQRRSPSPRAIIRPLQLSPKRLESVSDVASISISNVTTAATGERTGREHRPNSMERAASHKVEQWLSCSSSTSRLAADSTLSPKKSTMGVDSGCNQPEVMVERRNSRGVVTASRDKFDRRRSRESVEVVDLEQSPDDFVREAARCTSDKNNERSQCPDSSDVERAGNRRSKSRSPSLSTRSRRRSSSRSRSRSKNERRRSGSSEHRKRSRSRSGDLEGHKKSRRQRAASLPQAKPQHVSIYSLMLWLDRLNPKTTETDLKLELARFGRPSVLMESSRGCAYVKFSTRHDAADALDRLFDTRIGGVVAKVRWAPGAGVKNSRFSDYFDVDSGVTYIPWNKLPDSLATLSDGGTVDEATLPSSNQQGSVLTAVGISPVKLTGISSAREHHELVKQASLECSLPSQDKPETDKDHTLNTFSLSSLPNQQKSSQSIEQLQSTPMPSLVSASSIVSSGSITPSKLLYSPSADTPPNMSVRQSPMSSTRFMATFNPAVPPPSFSVLPTLLNRPASFSGVKPLSGSAEKLSSDERERLKISDDMDLDESSGDEMYLNEQNRADRGFVNTQVAGTFAPTSNIAVVSNSCSVSQNDQRPPAMSVPSVNGSSDGFVQPMATAVSVMNTLLMSSPMVSVQSSAIMGPAHPMSRPGDVSIVSFSNFSEGNSFIANLPPGGFLTSMPRPDGTPNVSYGGPPPGQIRMQMTASQAPPTGRFLGPMDQPPPSGWLQPPVDVSVRPPVLISGPRGPSASPMADGIRGPGEMFVDGGVRARMQQPSFPVSSQDVIQMGRMPVFNGPGEPFNAMGLRPSNEYIQFGVNTSTEIIRAPVDMNFTLGQGANCSRSYSSVSDPSAPGIMSVRVGGSRDDANSSMRQFQEPIRGQSSELNSSNFSLKPQGLAEETFRFPTGMNSVSFAGMVRGPFDPHVSNVSGISNMQLVTSSMAPSNAGFMMRGPIDVSSVGGGLGMMRGPVSENPNVRLQPPFGSVAPGGSQFRNPGSLNADALTRFPNNPMTVQQGPGNDLQRGLVPLTDNSRFSAPPVGLRPCGQGDMMIGPLHLGDGSRMSGPSYAMRGPNGDLIRGPLPVNEVPSRVTPGGMVGSSVDSSRGSIESFSNSVYSSGVNGGANECGQARSLGPTDNTNGMMRAPGTMFRAPVEMRFDGPVGAGQNNIGSNSISMLRGPMDGNFQGCAIRGPTEGNFLGSGIRGPAEGNFQGSNLGSMPPTSGNIASPYGSRNCVNDRPGLLGPMPSGMRASGGVGFGMTGAPPALNSNEIPRMPTNMQTIGSSAVNTGMQMVDQHINGPMRGMVDNMRGPANDNTGSGRLVGFSGGSNNSGLSDSRGGFGGGLNNTSGGLHAFGSGSVRSDDDGLPMARELLRNQLSAATSQSFRPLLGSSGSTRQPIPSLMDTEPDGRLRLPGVPQLTTQVPINERLLSAASLDSSGPLSGLAPRLLPPPPRIGELSRSGVVSGSQRPADSNLGSAMHLGSPSSVSIPSLVAGSDILTGLGIAGGWLPQRQSARGVRGNDSRRRTRDRSGERSSSSWENDRRRSGNSDRPGGQGRDRERDANQRRTQRNDSQRNNSQRNYQDDSRWNSRREWNRRPDKRRDGSRGNRRDHEMDCGSDGRSTSYNECDSAPEKQSVLPERNSVEGECRTNEGASVPSSSAQAECGITHDSKASELCNPSALSVEEIKSESKPREDSASVT